MTNGVQNTRRKPPPSRRPPSPLRSSIDSREGGRYRRAGRRGAASNRGEGIMSDVGGIAGAQLKSLIERIERLEDEKRALGEDIKEVYAEAKGTGFEPKIMRQLIKIRKMDKDEQESLLDLYKRALGMLPETASEAQAAE